MWSFKSLIGTIGHQVDTLLGDNPETPSGAEASPEGGTRTEREATAVPIELTEVVVSERGATSDESDRSSKSSGGGLGWFGAVSNLVKTAVTGNEGEVPEFLLPTDIQQRSFQDFMVHTTNATNSCDDELVDMTTTLKELQAATVEQQIFRSSEYQRLEERWIDVNRWVAEVHLAIEARLEKVLAHAGTSSPTAKRPGESSAAVSDNDERAQILRQLQSRLLSLRDQSFTVCDVVTQRVKLLNEEDFEALSTVLYHDEGQTRAPPPMATAEEQRSSIEAAHAEDVFGTIINDELHLRTVLNSEESEQRNEWEVTGRELKQFAFAMIERVQEVQADEALGRHHVTVEEEDASSTLDAVYTGVSVTVAFLVKERQSKESRRLADEQTARQHEANAIAAEEEAARVADEQEAEAARVAAEQEAEAARVAAEQEAEAARIAAEEEAARVAAEQEAEAARVAAEQEAEAARIAAEEEAARVAAELEAACLVVADTECTTRQALTKDSFDFLFRAFGGWTEAVEQQAREAAMDEERLARGRIAGEHSAQLDFLSWDTPEPLDSAPSVPAAAPSSAPAAAPGEESEDDWDSWS